MKKYIFNNTELCIEDNGKFYIYPKGYEHKQVKSWWQNFEVKVCGMLKLFDYDRYEETATGVKLFYHNDEVKLSAEVALESKGNSGVLIQTVKVKNIGDEVVRLTSVSSSFVESIASSVDKPWFEKDIRIHICNNKWQCEGQWTEFTPRQLGIIPVTVHPSERETYKVTSIGSWSTAIYFPLVMVEEKDTNSTWFIETEGAHSWFIKVGAYGGYAQPDMFMEASSCDETIGGWFYDLKPGEEYSPERAFIGAVPGGFEEATQEICKFKRADSLKNYENGTPYVFFNDYMDSVWEMQKPELIIPLAEKAAEAGCEVFCVDGGWYENKAGAGLGDWQAKKEYFGEIGLADLAKKISSLGMVPGIWFEFDACSDTAELYQTEKDAIIKRHDAEIGGPRSFYNFSNKKVCEFLKSKVAEVYDMGYRFIKNDYNRTIGIGCTNNYDGNSPAEGEIRNANAFYAFIDDLHESFPGLMIENCGSGAMRSENKTLKRFYLQSTSDQEYYYNNPSIIMGTMPLLPPEKAGIWSYPYPALFDVRHDFKPDEEYIAERKDGYETSFNMVTSMMGTMYLSGRIDCCDEENFALVKESVGMYKEIRHLISKSHTVYPTGLCGINEKVVASLGLLSDEALLLAVWNINTGKEADVTIDLSKYVDKDITIDKVYPKLPGIDCKGAGKAIKVNLPEKTSAVLIKIPVK